MENQTIKINRTKEELRIYNVFSAIERRPLRRAMEYIGPVLGVILVVLFVIFKDIILLIVGLFFGLYPFMMRRTIRRSSDLSFDANNLKDYEINITFSKDYFSTSTSDAVQKILYNDLFRVYFRENDIVLYVSKFSGLYINKLTLTDEEVANISSFLQNAIPDKIKTFK